MALFLCFVSYMTLIRAIKVLPQQEILIPMTLFLCFVSFITLIRAIEILPEREIHHIISTSLNNIYL